MDYKTVIEVDPSGSYPNGRECRIYKNEPPAGLIAQAERGELSYGLQWTNVTKETGTDWEPETVGINYGLRLFVFGLVAGVVFVTLWAVFLC